MPAPPVLMIDGNPAMRAPIVKALREEGYEVLEAGAIEAGLRVVAERAPSLVLLDFGTPDMEGFDAGKRLRAASPDLPIIAVAGWAQPDDHRLLAAGFLDVLIKPVEPARLVEVVGRHLGRAHANSQHTGRAVLVVDDDPTQRKLARLILTSAGFEVTAAKDGAEALRLATLRKPDAIVSDILMPLMDGFALCRAVRSDPNLAATPVVLMSAYYMEPADRELAARFGAARCVARAGTFDDVVNALIEVIDAPAAATAASLPGDALQAEHLLRVAHQLEKQTTIGMGLVRRVAIQSSALTILDGLSESLAQDRDPESALGNTLGKCLDAAGVAAGAILLCAADGQLALKAQVGAPIHTDLGTYSELLLRAVAIGKLMIPSEAAGEEGARLLADVGARSALVVPLIARGEAIGVLLLASEGTDFVGAEGESAVRAARSVATQLGQALALSRLFSKQASTEKRYRALLEHASDGITITTPAGVILEMNRRMEDLLGIARSHGVGRPLAELVRTTSVEVSEALLGRGGASPPVSIRRADGTEVQVEFSSTVVEVEGDQYILNIGRDVSERLRLEDQLRQSQKMEAVGRLAGGIAHDFNNILSVILTYGELLMQGLKPGDPMRDDVAEIVTAGNRAAELTRQLLMFSRQQVVQPKVLDLNQLMIGMDKMLRRILGVDVDLVLLRHEPIGRVRADPGSIEQVVMNLVVNARDAMPTGGKLTLETSNVMLDDEHSRIHRGIAPGPYVMLAVTDTGIGMDAATQARMFEPFFTTKEKGKGTGLGLSTVFGIVQQSGGSVWVYSEPGKGTTFKVYLPRVDAPVDGVQVSGASDNLRGTETVLLVEDDDQVRTASREILRQSGYHVIDCRNAGEAIMQSEQHTGVIHLMVTDVVMPLISGPELAKRLEAARPEMKVLCMSGYTDDSIIRHGVLDSMVAYLQKPITPSSLTSKVREVLDSRSSGSAARGTGPREGLSGP